MSNVRLFVDWVKLPFGSVSGQMPRKRLSSMTALGRDWVSIIISMIDASSVCSGPFSRTQTATRYLGSRRAWPPCRVVVPRCRSLNAARAGDGVVRGLRVGPRQQRLDHADTARVFERLALRRNVLR
jgi:hypothetical protein